MNKFFLILLFLMVGFLQAQTIFQLQVVNINTEDSERFEMVEKNYATPLANQAKKNGQIQDWYLMRKVNGGKASDQITYIWVHVYKGINQMLNAGSWWDTQSKFGVPSEVIYGSVERNPYGNFTYKTEKSFDTDRSGKYVIFNWAKPSNMPATLNLANEISDSFKSNMKKSGMTSWGMATRVYPQGEDFAPLFFWDGYENLDQALEHLMNKAVLEVVKPEMFEKLFALLPNGFSNRIIMEAITGTD